MIGVSAAHCQMANGIIVITDTILSLLTGKVTLTPSSQIGETLSVHLNCRRARSGIEASVLVRTQCERNVKKDRVALARNSNR